MSHLLPRFLRRHVVSSALYGLGVVAIGLCVAFAGKLSIALALSLFIVASVGGTLRCRGKLKKLFHSARENGRDLALARTMAAASRQPFFFCSPVYACAGDLTGLSIRFVNRAACRALGISARRLRTISFCDVINPASALSLLRELPQVLQQTRSVDVPLIFKTVEGKLEQYDVRLIPLADGVAITTLQSREEELAQQRADAADHFTQSVFENAPLSIIATDPEGIIVAVNPAAEQLTLYRSYDLVGTHSILALHDAAELSARSVELSEATGKKVSAGFDSLTAEVGPAGLGKEWTYIRRDGSRTWVSLTMSPLRDPAGEVSGYLAIAFDVTERRRLTEGTEHMAHHDQLTGLPNRTQLEGHIQSCIQRAQRLNSGMAVYVVDIDHFKRMNDSLGHAGGDAVLVTVAERLLQGVRASDKVVRVGGDEFVLVLPDMANGEDASRRAQLILEGLSAPFFVGNREVRITASIGYCLLQDSSLSPASLLRRADVAMYTAKTAGRNSFREFTEELQQETTDRLEMEEDLRHAIERGELSLHYQPQVTCADREVAGVEMLLRWNNPKRGNVPPDVFISVAEEAGLMSDIGQWALRRACFDCMAVQASLGQRLRVAVNLSAREFLNAGLPDVVRNALAESHLRSEDLELEITEQLLMSKSHCLLKTLQDLRDLGVSLAIDDFGTGFSNFSYILQYHVDRLKIDRSFISRLPEDAGAVAIVRSVIAMAHGLGMKVCAEGVETSEQLEFLARRRCDDIQGYYFSKAVPLAQLADAIRAIQAEPPRVRRAPHRVVNYPQRALAATSAA